MLTVKRKRLDRDVWMTIVKKSYRQTRIDTDSFCGWAALLQIHKNVGVTDWGIEGKPLPVSRDGMFWVELLPDGEDFAVTEMHDPNGNVVFYYLDMIDGTGTDSDGVKTFDDLFLDVIVSAGYEAGSLPPFCKIDDRAELDNALSDGVITEAQYHKALTACERAQTLFKNGTIPSMCHAAFEALKKF